MFPCSRMKQESTTTTLSSAAVITASEIIPLFVKNCFKKLVNLYILL